MTDPIRVVYATGDASVNVGGAQIPVRKGQHWPAGDPIVAQYPDLFSPDSRWGMAYTVEPSGYNAPPMDSIAAAARGIPVEQATAVPGEKRSTRRPAS